MVTLADITLDVLLEELGNRFENLALIGTTWVRDEEVEVAILKGDNKINHYNLGVLMNDIITKGEISTYSFSNEDEDDYDTETS